MNDAEVKEFMIETGYRDATTNLMVLCLLLRLLMIAVPIGVVLVILALVYSHTQPVTHPVQVEPIQVEQTR